MMTEEELVEQFRQARPIPSVMYQLGEMIRHPSATLRDAEQLLGQDAARATRLLTILNHPVSPVPWRLTDIGQALSTLGMKELYRVLATDEMRTLILNVSGSTIFSPQDLWRHSATSALCCKMIAEHIFSLDGHEAYLTGLFHATGLLPVTENRGRDFLRIAAGKPVEDMNSLLQREEEVLHTNHYRIGYLMALKGGLPVEVAEAIRDHCLALPDTQPQSLRGILMISEYITHKLWSSIFKTNAPPNLGPVLKSYILGNREEYSILAEELPEELKKMQQMYND